MRYYICWYCSSGSIFNTVFEKCATSTLLLLHTLSFASYIHLKRPTVLHLKKDTFLGKSPDEVVVECQVLIIPETEIFLR